VYISIQEYPKEKEVQTVQNILRIESDIQAQCILREEDELYQRDSISSQLKTEVLKIIIGSQGRGRYPQEGRLPRALGIQEEIFSYESRLRNTCPS
jgi:hypothetical protein